jgi:hypothetical protein
MAAATAKQRRVLLAAALAGTVALISGCGSDDDGSSPAPTIPAADAELLAGESEDVAAALESGDACAAQEQAGELQSAAAAVEPRLASELGSELRSGVAILVSGIECVPEEKPEEKDEKEEKEEENDEGEDGRGPDGEGPPGFEEGSGESDKGPRGEGDGG